MKNKIVVFLFLFFCMSPPALPEESKREHVQVAPLFEHGEGNHTTGCFSPLAGWVGEERARRIIEKKLNEAGVVVDQWDLKIPEVVIDQHCEWGGQFGKMIFTLDGYNEKYNIGFEYVSTEDAGILGGIYTGLPPALVLKSLDEKCFSSQSEPSVDCEQYRSLYDKLNARIDIHDYIELDINTTCMTGTTGYFPLKDLSQSLRMKMLEYDKMNIIIFYDPLVKHSYPVTDKFSGRKRDDFLNLSIFGIEIEGQSENCEWFEMDCTYKDEDLLIRQITDGIHWLKDNDLIP